METFPVGDAFALLLGLSSDFSFALPEELIAAPAPIMI